ASEPTSAPTVVASTVQPWSPAGLASVSTSTTRRDARLRGDWFRLRGTAPPHASCAAGVGPPAVAGDMIPPDPRPRGPPPPPAPAPGVHTLQSRLRPPPHTPTTARGPAARGLLQRRLPSLAQPPRTGCAAAPIGSHAPPQTGGPPRRRGPRGTRPRPAGSHSA